MLELGLKNDLIIKENKILYGLDEELILWPGKVILLKNRKTLLKSLNLGSRFGIVLEEDCMDSGIFLIQTLFCYAYDEYLTLRLVNLNYHDAPLKLAKETPIGKILPFD